MSEVQDACQIVIVTGKSAYWIGKITTQLTMMILKLMNTIYLAKWKGATTLNRFRNIKGDDFMFINASTEDRALLQHIEKEMEDHGILFAQLPDLCGGDGRTQYVISPSDSAKFKAFLLDHNAGRYRDVKVGPISAEDYARSGIDRDGKETPEMRELSRSANEAVQEQKQIGMNQTTGYLTMQESTTRAIWPLRVWGRRREPVRQPASENTELPLTSPMVQYHLVRHDEQITEQGNISWITKAPLKRHEKWAMYEMPDGIHTVIIPNSDQYQVAGRDGVAYRAAIYEERMYRVVNMKNGNMELSSGLEVAEALNKPDIRTENERLKNLAHNRGLDINSIRDDFSRTGMQELPNAVHEDLEHVMGHDSAQRDSSYTPERGAQNGVRRMSFSEGQYLALVPLTGNEYQIPFRTEDGRECYAIIPEKDCRMEYDYALDGSGRMEWVLTTQIQPDEKYDVFYYAADSTNTGVIRDEMNGSALEMALVPQNLREAELSGESKALVSGIPVPSGENERLSVEKDFLASDSECFAIYRFSDDIHEWSYKGHDLAYAEKLGLRVDGADYDMVYSGSLSEVKSVQDLYDKFSGQLKPSDFPGESLAMSDVVVVNHDGKTTAWYIDYSGFSRNAFIEMPEFVEQRDSYIMERQLHPDAERHIAQNAEMFRKERTDKTVLPDLASQKSNKEKLPAVKRTRPVKPRKNR